MNKYYYETKGCRGWRDAETDEQVIRGFEMFSFVKIWRVEGSEKTLIFSKKVPRKREMGF